MKRSTAIVMAIAAAGALSACGSSADQSPKAMSTAVDAFTQSVQSIVAAASDTALPMAVDAIAALDADSATPVVVR